MEWLALGLLIAQIACTTGFDEASKKCMMEERRQWIAEAFIGQGGILDDFSAKQFIAERSYKQNNKKYVVVYLYSATSAFVPAIVGGAQIHYEAQISVYEVINLDRKLIFKPFNGHYTAKGCFEDNPKTLVEYALLKAKEDADEEP